MCPQGLPRWSKERSLFLEAYLQGKGSVEEFTHVPPPGFDPSPKAPAQTDGRANEDCLFLEVIVPKDVYNRPSSYGSGKKAPVVVWTYGGGFYEGSTQSQGNPAGLVAESMRNQATSPGIVYVAINYRLGALGWLSGPTFSESGGTPNAGLHDQRLALDWVQEHIHLFGGDPQQVTVAGESAGATMNLHQITAYGGKVDAPFQQAVMMSPAFNPNPYNSFQEEAFQGFLQYANATSLADLRALPSEAIIAANSQAIYNTSYGGGLFGPVVDGTFVPQLPSLSLREGRHATNVKAIFAAHNSDEGLIFTNPSVQNTSAFNVQLSSFLPDAESQVLDLIKNTLYPPIFNNLTGLGYNDTISRLATLEADLLINCNVYAALEAFNANVSHGFLFAEGAGLHGEETPYTFYTYGTAADAYGFGTVNGTVAQELQDWILAFAATGNPNGRGEAKVPVYGEKRELGLLSGKGVGISVMDLAAKERCEFWNKGLYF